MRDRYIRLNAVQELTGLSRTKIYRKIETGTFPRQILFSKRCARWSEVEVMNWLRDQISFTADRFPPANPR
jgi:prophage regulatory protein